MKPSYLQIWKNVKHFVFMSMPGKEEQIPCDLPRLQNLKDVVLIVAESIMMVAREWLESETSENMAKGLKKTLQRIKMLFGFIIYHCASN